MKSGPLTYSAPPPPPPPPPSSLTFKTVLFLLPQITEIVGNVWKDQDEGGIR